MKPHEETWTTADGGCVFEGEHIATFWGACSVADPRAVLAAAAPEMARAILGLGEIRDGAWHTRECWAANRGCIIECQPLALALVKAGVIAS